MRGITECDTVGIGRNRFPSPLAVAERIVLLVLVHRSC
jgi:hypothetical protein